jgi:RHS repeat-associated protein
LIKKETLIGEKVIWKYDYDLFNRLVKVTKNDSVISEYMYDEGGLRIKKTSPKEQVYYVFDTGGNVLYEQENREYMEYIYVLGKHFARVDGDLDNGIGKKYFYHTDHLGSTVAVTDEAGKKVWDTEYTPFGKTAAVEGELKNAAKFTGKDWDEDVNLWYYNARWYDQETGRFISEDPLAQNPNLYLYCANNPLKLIDPSGLWHYEADSKNGEVYAVADKGDTLSGLGKEVYGSAKASSEVAKINDIKDVNKIKEGQKVKLEALEGFSNDKYSQLLKNSFILGDLSYSDLVKNGVTAQSFNDKEVNFLTKYVERLETLHKNKEIDDKAYKQELERLGGKGAVYEFAYGNIVMADSKIYNSTKEGYGIEFTSIDEKILDIVTFKALGGDIGVKWSLPGVSYNSNTDKTSSKNIGIKVSLEYSLASAKAEIPIGPVSVVFGGKVAAGLGLKLGYTPGDTSGKFYGVSAALGFGLEVGLKLNK